MTPAYANEVMDQAQAAYQNEDYALAFKGYTAAANEGNARACFQLGKMWEQGEGVDVDQKKALQWYRRSAELGFTCLQSTI